MKRTTAGCVVHLELHTGDLAGARAFYAASWTPGSRKWS